jgi:endo-1,4-beta-xylanase
MKRIFMKRMKLVAILSTIVVMGCASNKSYQSADNLKDAFDGLFYIGTAMNTPQITGQNTQALEVIKKHMNSIVAENVMKSEILQPREGEFDFTLADQFVQFGVDNNMHIVGHTLIWHSQAPRWFFADENGNDVSPEVLKQRMKDHIFTVVGRYKGKVHGWDVVNECIVDDGSWRNSKFYQILGEDFVKYAFQFAAEADPDAELYYNDYSMALPGRRQGVIDMVKNLQAQGVKVDGIGMQGHLMIDHPSLEDFETSLLAFAGLGVHIMITELDVSVLPFPTRNVGADVSLNIAYNTELNPYPDGLSDEVAQKLHDRWLDLYRLFIKHHDKITRVTTWGTHDGMSWKNNWPVRGRTDYPLLFDREYQPKPVVFELIKEAQAVKR